MKRAGSVILIALAAVALLAACEPDESAGDLPPVGEELVALQKSKCEARGGIWGQGGLENGGFTCFKLTRDANTSCRRNSDCEGLCLARSRSCAPMTPFLGCHEVLTESGLVSTVCTD